MNQLPFPPVPPHGGHPTPPQPNPAAPECRPAALPVHIHTRMGPCEGTWIGMPNHLRLGYVKFPCWHMEGSTCRQHAAQHGEGRSPPPVLWSHSHAPLITHTRLTYTLLSCSAAAGEHRQPATRRCMAGGRLNMPKQPQYSFIQAGHACPVASSWCTCVCTPDVPRHTACCGTGCRHTCPPGPWQLKTITRIAAAAAQMLPQVRQQCMSHATWHATLCTKAHTHIPHVVVCHHKTCKPCMVALRAGCCGSCRELHLLACCAQYADRHPLPA